MKTFFKIFFSIILFFIILGIIFYMVDSTRVKNGEETIFTFYHKIVDGIDYSGKIDCGLGYKIIKFDVSGEEIIKIGTLFMDESLPFFIKDVNNSVNESDIISGESGEKIVKLTTFGESYKDLVLIEGLEEEINVKKINSKLGYTMSYYHDLFEYAGFEDHDSYLWHLSSGEDKAIMTVYDVSDEEIYKESLEKIEDEKLFEVISGETTPEIKNVYYRTFKEDEVSKVNYIYMIELDSLKLMVDLYYKEEASEGIGVYMNRMAKTIKSLSKD